MTTKKTKPAAVETGTEATDVTEAAVATTPTKATKAPRSGKAGKASTGTAKAAKPRRKPAVGHGEATAERKPRTETKQAKLIAMLQTKDGATVEEIARAFGWQAHTVRGAIAGALKKKLGLNVISEKIEDRGRVYRLC